MFRSLYFIALLFTCAFSQQDTANVKLDSTQKLQKFYLATSMETKDPYVGFLSALVIPGGGNLYVEQSPAWHVALQVLVPIAGVSIAASQDFKYGSESIIYIGVGAAFLSKLYDMWTAPAKARLYNKDLMEKALKYHRKEF
ncbi:MAG: hypothetical protein ACLFVE_11375 [Chitinispirillaceae bacterium]